MSNNNFQHFLENNQFLNQIERQEQKQSTQIFSLKHQHTISSGNESSSDEDGLFEQYLEDRPNHGELLDELYNKMQEEEGIPKTELEREQQWQIAELQAKVLMLEFECGAMKRMNHDLKSREHKQSNIIEDQKKDKEMMDKVKLTYDKKFFRMDEDMKQTTHALHQLQKLMNTKVSDLHDSAMKRVKQLVKINDNVEVFDDSSKKQIRPQTSLPAIKEKKSSAFTK